MTRLRIAIVHDYLVQMRGGERVVAVLHRTFPDATIYTSAYSAAATGMAFRSADLRTSFMQHLPGIIRHYRSYLPLYPLAFRFDLSRYDVIISSSSGWAHGVRSHPGQVHLCYCYTPARWLWDLDHYLSRERLGRGAKVILAPLIRVLRKRDLKAAQGPDRYIAISEYIAERIRRVYQREPLVLYPPVATQRFREARVANPDEYFLVVCHLSRYKRVDLAVRACSELGLPLKVAGVGPDYQELRRQAGPTVQFLGHVDDDELPPLMARCRAFILPGQEDFGIAPVEAMAAGRPVIAYGGGGALETVKEGVTGLFFREQTVESLARVLADFAHHHWDSARIQAHAAKFDEKVFSDRFAALVEREVAMKRERMAYGTLHPLT